MEYPAEIFLPGSGYGLGRLLYLPVMVSYPDPGTEPNGPKFYPVLDLILVHMTC